MIKNARAIVGGMPDPKARWIDRKAMTYFFPDILGQQAVALGRGQ
jgi:hypothetical protein